MIPDSVGLLLILVPHLRIPLHGVRGEKPTFSTFTCAI